MNSPEPAHSPPRRLSATRPPLPQRRSLEHANQVSLQISGNQVGQSPDPQGQRLRQIRKAQGLDPSRVATEACISLGQLYELETGGRRLFYSETLRQQAGRRVALMLGCDWDALHPMPAPSPSGASPASPSDPDASASTITGQTMAPMPEAAPGTQTHVPSAIASSAALTTEDGNDHDHGLHHGPDSTPGPEGKESARTGETDTTRAERLLRAGVWGLLAVALMLTAARLGWVPGIQLPL